MENSILELKAEFVNFSVCERKKLTALKFM